ncbi:FAD-dependent oxidoreductase [Xanthocytophaga agilis]|uniref:FAD-dependent oxidoreductase n=1 Tax=Xanthocytophaga agilis TaxID=3048010 RepID=A0AAE3UGY8_9BACT|nr:FAD-dependent oxidoreductase [Xanthocytophaga agilis]MDJ1504870.1 FAD-dependent oxidoreductase [Xanthocytophaga agilis]
MRRDGKTTSLWQDQIPDYESDNQALKSGKIYDVLVVGGGITGITTALLLQKSGKNCIVAEANSIGFGTTGGTTAHLNTMLDTDYHTLISNFDEKSAQMVAGITREAIEMIRQLANSYQANCEFKELPGYLFAQDEEQAKYIDKIVEASRKAGISIEYTNQIPINVSFQKALVFDKQAQFHPTRYLYALANAFEKAGGTLLQDCKVTNIEEGDIIQVPTSQGTIQARQVVYATHIPPGVNLLHFRCAPYRSYVLAVTLNNEAQYPDALVYDMQDPYHYYRTQDIDGKRYLIVGGEDHKTAHMENTETCFRNLESHVRQYFDVDQIAFRWSSQYFETTDGLPYIGHLPGASDNIYVATGFSGNGMTLGTVAAIVLNELLTTGQSPYKDLFAPGRVKPVAGFTSFVKEQADVIKEFASKWFSQSDLGELADLAHDEARVVEYEGTSIAMYKDEYGRIHAVNPTCPHAKCAVAWNSTEKSWDCPCHGSRFSCDGELLTGPARSNLEKINIDELEEADGE